MLALVFVATSAKASEFGNSWFTIEPYRLTYFLFGKPDAKVQFSGKMRFVSSVPVYFGYSQLTKWELFVASAPFRDVNYNPELFYRMFFEPPQLVKDGNPTPPHYLDFGIYSHESNGRDGFESRSWDKVYFRWVRGWRVGDRAAIIAQMQLNVPVRLDSGNPDLLWYRGIFEGEVAWVRFLDDTFDESELRFRIFSGGPSHVNLFAGGQELTLRLKPRAHTFLPTFVVQVFNGFGENLLDYKQERLAVRVGLGL